MDIGGHVVLVVSLRELETLKVGLTSTMFESAGLEDTPENRPRLWAERRATELLNQFPTPFKCEAFVYAGPGHQSKHECEIESIHPIEGEHHDFNTEWTGTAYYETPDEPWVFTNVGPEDMNIEIGGQWTSVDGYKWRRPFDGGWEYQAPGKRRLINPKHTNGSCGCSGW
jgi:hypothetical protein